jgi:cysteinyl-tRNA synthetase
VYNSLTNKKDEFKPVDPYQVTWYICGPTVYDVSHMGHARTYVTFDIIRRILSEHFGYNVMQVMNITDIDDKIIRSSMEQGISFNEFSRKWENEFMTDMKSLGVALPDCITRVSEYVPEIIEYIEKIIENGFAYEANGSVYFATNTFDNDPKHNYAKLEPLSKSNTALL